MRVLSVPTIRDRSGDFLSLFCLWRDATSTKESVEIDFSRCKFFMQNGVAFLGGLAKLLEHRGQTLTFRWETIRPEVRASLGGNGFLTFFGQPGHRPIGTAAQFRQDTALNTESLVGYLVQDWIGTGRVQLSAALKEAVVSTAWEIYANAFEHARSPVGVFSCGQHYPTKHLLELTVVDFGLGIPENVREFLGRPHMSGAEALQWAFKRGNTTTLGQIARGMGLDLLKEFVNVNRGKVELFTNDAYAVVDARSPGQQNRELIFAKGAVPFTGTVVNIVFRCTSHYYRFASEVSSKPLF